MVNERRDCVLGDVWKRCLALKDDYEIHRKEETVRSSGTEAKSSVSHVAAPSSKFSSVLGQLCSVFSQPPPLLFKTVYIVLAPGTHCVDQGDLQFIDLS